MAMSLGVLAHETDAVTSAVWPSWKVPSALSCVVAPGGETGYCSVSIVVVGEMVMLVRPCMGGGPESPPNDMPPSPPPVEGNPDDFGEPQPHARAADRATTSRKVAPRNR
jgi:hypothetical protein